MPRVGKRAGKRAPQPPPPAPEGAAPSGTLPSTIDGQIHGQDGASEIATLETDSANIVPLSHPKPFMKLGQPCSTSPQVGFLSLKKENDSTTNTFGGVVSRNAEDVKLLRVPEAHKPRGEWVEGDTTANRGSQAIIDENIDPNDARSPGGSCLSSEAYRSTKSSKRESVSNNGYLRDSSFSLETGFRVQELANKAARSVGLDGNLYNTGPLAQVRGKKRLHSPKLSPQRQGLAGDKRPCLPSTRAPLHQEHSIAPLKPRGRDRNPDHISRWRIPRDYPDLDLAISVQEVSWRAVDQDGFPLSKPGDEPDPITPLLATKSAKYRLENPNRYTQPNPFDPINPASRSVDELLELDSTLSETDPFTPESNLDDTPISSGHAIRRGYAVTHYEFADSLPSSPLTVRHQEPEDVFFSPPPRLKSLLRGGKPPQPFGGNLGEEGHHHFSPQSSLTPRGGEGSGAVSGNRPIKYSGTSIHDQAACAQYRIGNTQHSPEGIRSRTAVGNSGVDALKPVMLFRKPDTRALGVIDPSAARVSREAFDKAAGREAVEIETVGKFLHQDNSGHSWLTRFRMVLVELCNLHGLAIPHTISPMTSQADVLDEKRNSLGERLTDSIKQMMYVSGETGEPSVETTGIIEDIVRAQVVEIVSC
jgi:Transcription initiation factor IID, 18kD subunit